MLAISSRLHCLCPVEVEVHDIVNRGVPIHFNEVKHLSTCRSASIEESLRELRKTTPKAPFVSSEIECAGPRLDTTATTSEL